MTMTEPASVGTDQVATAALQIRNPQSAIRNFAGAHFYVIALLLLTAVGGLMRFSFLDKPPIWFDEAATYARTCARYSELLEALEEAGFGPLHYSAYWWIKNGMPTWGKLETVQMPAVMRGNEFGRMRTGPRTNGMVEVRDLIPTHPLIKSGSVSMTPFMMRLIPAICGTLMIPAMYWLARELSGRRSVALLAALLTTFSAYLLNYSRDGKMYMDFWLFATLHVAALLWWLRTRRMIPWWCWIIAGTVMIGMHLLGAIVLAIDLIIVLTAKRPHWKYHVPVLLTPVAAVAASGEWMGSTAWRLVHDRAFSLPGPSKAWRFFTRFYRGFRVPALLGFLVGMFVLGIGPYGYYKVFNKYAQRITERGWMGSGLQWIKDYNEGRTPREQVQYAATAFLTGWEWPRRSTDLLLLKDGSAVEGDVRRAGRNWKVTKKDGSIVEVPNEQMKSREEGQLDEKLIKPSTMRFLKWGSVAIAITLTLGAFPWRWPWRKRGVGASPMLSRLEPTAPGPDAHAAEALDRFTVAHGWRRMLYITLWIVLPPFGVYLVSHPAGSLPKLPGETFGAMIRATSMVQWSLDAFSWLKVHPVIASAIIVVAIICFLVCAPTWRRRLRQASALIAIALIAILLCAAFRDLYPYLDASLLKSAGRGWRNHDSMWMPRYMGLILPALFVLVAMLMLRLPTRPVRALAILIFLVMNMYQFAGRVFAGTEPPVDRMVADSIAWRKSESGDGTLKMYYNVRRPQLQAGLGPGTGVLSMPTARYYWTIYTDSPAHPDEIRGMGSPIDSRFPPYTSSATSIKTDVAKKPELSRLIVWDSFDTNKGDSSDKTLAALGTGWQREGADELFYARDHWTWRDLFTIRRRVYVRDPNAPTTLPTTAPATLPATGPIDK
ncbi:hypothetical protein BH09PLA1_BH09PLA1_03090 [soil metagenome]